MALSDGRGRVNGEKRSIMYLQQRRLLIYQRLLCGRKEISQKSLTALLSCQVQNCFSVRSVSYFDQILTLVCDFDQTM